MPTVNEVLSQAWGIHQQGNLAVAENIYRQVAEQVPTSPNVWCYLGILLHDRREFEESEVVYRKALALQNSFPICWNNLGNTLRMLGRLEEADAAFETALQQDPNYLSPLKNRGTLWVWTGQLDRGSAAFEAGLELAPNEPELHRNLGVISLLQGDFDKGWPEYRWRWEMPGFNRPNITKPVWDGGEVAGRTVLLYPEQGLGDTIQFIRMADELQQRGARTVVQVPPRLIPLLGSCPGISQLVPDGMPVGEYDFHCSLIDVADRLGLTTKTIPAKDAYLSIPDTLEAYWSRWLSDLGTKKKIGICWQGNRDHQADVFRSIPLTEFASLTSIENCQLISLQHGYGCEQLDQVGFADAIVRLPGNIDQSSGAFLDTAAIIRGLDLVITSDTSLAHLAGAIGAPVWVALPQVPDWRWLLSGDTTPWYPTMRLFRQHQMQDWNTVFANIADCLKNNCNSQPQL